jgi:cell division initiation protein
MRITPLDIIQKKFSTASRGGYDNREVDSFLEELRASMEEDLKENQRLRDMLGRRDAENAELRSNEGEIKETLLLARRLTDEMDRNARREADVIVGEARIEAERILMTAADERRDIQTEIVQLRSQRLRLLADLKAVVDVYGRMIRDLESEGVAS